MIVSVSIKALQHLGDLKVSFDFSRDPLICMTSKNGVGKTSIIKALALLRDTAVISKTSSVFSISEDTQIDVTLNSDVYTFRYSNGDLDTRDILRDESFINVELPIPYGKRFSEFPALGNIDMMMREMFLKGDYQDASDLIEFMKSVYRDVDKFQNLKVVRIKGENYYFLPLDNNRYIREDYFSSGEFFVISIFKMIMSPSRFLIIDEIDVSLDSSAQVSLMNAVRSICLKMEKKILFTTHSLAIMKTIYEFGTPIIYLKNEDGEISHNLVSYSFIQLEMFGFQGYDKFIFTEDVTLEQYINYKLTGLPILNRYKVIYIGGCDNVIDLLKRNALTHFICQPAAAKAILDGDAAGKYGHRQDVIISPFDDIEDEIYRKYKEENAVHNLPNVAPENAKSKIYWKKLHENCEQHGLTREDIFRILETGFEQEADDFTQALLNFIDG
ncbi:MULTISPECIES: AAA family ATPase [Klebsiella pneumoniae complex]|uniref:AAA family ATPase n=1 Tax=Klebsiella pneumoniae complex TaxID=3390273 RepID=UPI00186759CF|nr:MULTISPECIES: AAA family ATPase [Klebsiella]EKX6513429.1 AAA family ATPase [Klebsiella pneumoniae]QPO40248.1 AAA family ATPase [Klebsiella pneumoniae]HCI4216240.1 AAA family ATPase [Klebsiella pneumoniae]